MCCATLAVHSLPPFIPSYLGFIPAVLRADRHADQVHVAVRGLPRVPAFHQGGASQAEISTMAPADERVLIFRSCPLYFLTYNTLLVYSTLLVHPPRTCFHLAGTPHLDHIPNPSPTTRSTSQTRRNEAVEAEHKRRLVQQLPHTHRCAFHPAAREAGPPAGCLGREIAQGREIV